jgi:hypothetical protein
MAIATVEYPTSFTPELRPLQPGYGLSEPTDTLLQELRAHGFVMAVGVHESQLDNLADMASQPHIREFCPNDVGRFGSEPRVRKWQQKGTGRVMVGIYAVNGESGPLDEDRVASLRAEDLTQVAYGWFGAEPTPHMPPGVDITTAYRVGQQGRELARKRRTNPEQLLSLGLSIGKAVLAVATELYGIAPERIGLETWESNEAANKLYDLLGFQLVAAEEDVRPTLQRAGSNIRNKIVFHRLAKILVQDRRLYKVLAPSE